MVFAFLIVLVLTLARPRLDHSKAKGAAVK